MSVSFTSTKGKEAKGFEWLKREVEGKLRGALLRPTMNKGSDTKEAVADAILEYDGRSFDIEIKVIGKAIPTNIRFTHQTVSKSRGKDLIVALIYNFDEHFDEPEKTEVRFFRLGSVASSLQVEPHFIVQKGDLSKHRALQDLNALSDMLKGDPALLNLPCVHWRNEDNHWRLIIEWEKKMASPS